MCGRCERLPRYFVATAQLGERTVETWNAVWHSELGQFVPIECGYFRTPTASRTPLWGTVGESGRTRVGIMLACDLLHCSRSE